MRSIIKSGVCILLVLLAGATVQAELQFVDNFDGMASGNLAYNVATVGGGGVLSTNTGAASGNIYVEANGGSQVVRFMTTTDGTGSRGFGVAGIDNTIADTEKGTLFFRFMIRVEGNAADTYFGIHALSGDTPFSVAGNDPENYLVAGFHAVNGSGTSVNLVGTRDLGTVLLAGLTRGQWYNCWIDADHKADTFDLYVSAAAGPAGEATLPTAADKIGDDLPFYWGTANPTSALTGAFFATPRLSSTTRSTTQSARAFVDEIYWDGDTGLVFITKGARNPVPGHKATEVTLDQNLSWDGPDDPNVAAVVGYDVYMGLDAAEVADGDPSALASAGQTAVSYDPGLLAYDTEYFWRVETTVRMDDPNQTLVITPGSVWSFTTLSSLPTITQQPANVIAEAGQTAEFTIAVESIKPASYQWYKSADRANDTFDDDVLVSGATLATLTLSAVSAADEGYYYCKVSNPSLAYSDAASLGVKREVAHWTLGQSDFDAANELYLDTVGGYHARVRTAGHVPAFVDGAAAPVIDGAVAFDPNTYGVVSLLNPSVYTDRMTLSAWIKWDGGPLNEFGNVILQKGTVYETWMWSLKLRQSGGNMAGVRFYNNFGYTVQTGNLIESNVWTHVCAIWDGTAIRVYINGVLAGTDTSGAMGTDTLGDLHIASSDDFPGALDDIRIFNTAFDLTEIALQLYGPVSGKSVCVNPNDPILLAYDFNKNCVVDLADFAVMASHWMECYLVPDCIERPQ